MTEAMAQYILRRDGQCVAAILDPTHRCKTRFGEPHKPDDMRKLTIDHVKKAARLGVRAESDDPRCMVALCGWANVEGWASAHRQDERDYIAKVEPQ